MRLLPADLQDATRFQRIMTLRHADIKPFIIAQFLKKGKFIRWYNVLQLSAITLITYTLVVAVIKSIDHQAEILQAVGLGVLTSCTILIIIHELLHALAYLLVGARRIRFGADIRKFVFYAQADQQVLSKKSFYFLALTPLVVVTIVSMTLAIWMVFVQSPYVYLWLTIGSIHIFFCSGDIGLMDWFNEQKAEDLFTYDDAAKSETYFYSSIHL